MVADEHRALGRHAVESEQPQDQNVAYVHLEFLQRASGNRKLGVVTQFNVKVADPSQLESVAAAIDAEFARDPDPTHTSAVMLIATNRARR